MASIRKVKFKPGTLEIHTSSSTGDQETEMTTKSFEDPHPDLVNAFSALVPVVYDILRIPRDMWAGAVKVTGVSFSESDTGAQGAVITAQVAIEGCGSPLILNTPHMPFELPNPTSGASTMPPFAVDRLQKLQEEAASFLTGKRAQLDLPGTDQTLTRKSLDERELAEAKR